MRDHLRMQRIDRGAVGGIEHDAHQRGLRQRAQADDVMEGAAAAQEMRALVLAHRQQIPHLGEEAQHRRKLGAADLHAAQRADFCGCHQSVTPRKRAALS